MKDLYEYATENGYEVVSTTSELSGYPRNIQKALIGFSTFEELERVADEVGGTAVSLMKKNGWDLYARRGWPIEEMKITAADYGDDYLVFNHDELSYLEEFYADERKSLLEELTERELADYDAKNLRLIEELKKTKENEAVVSYQGTYCETIEAKTMSWYDEGNGESHVIGLLID